MGIYFKTEKENNQKEKKYNMAGYRISCTVQVSGPKLIWKDVIYTFFKKKKKKKKNEIFTTRDKIKKIEIKWLK